MRFGPTEQADPAWIPAREPLLMPFTVMRREAVRVAGGFRQAFHTDDGHLYWRLRRLGSLVTLPDRVGSDRLHAQSDTGKSLQTTRIMAMTSQLAALAAAWVEGGGSEMRFPLERYRTDRAAGTMAGIYEAGCQELSRAEAEPLQSSGAPMAAIRSRIRRTRGNCGASSP